MKRIKIAAAFLLFFTWMSAQTSYEMLAGTYTRGTGSEGIYLLQFNKRGKLKSKELLVKTENPSYLAFSPDKNYVYAVNELGDQSSVSAFRFDRKNKTLELINRVEAGGADPCYITVSEKHVFTANYSGGSISVFETRPDGSLSEVIEIIEHPRKHFGNNRFGPSHVHQVIFSPDSSLLYATNLGTDRLFAYRYHPENKKDILTELSSTALKRGSGPRHITFSRDGQMVYMVQELDASVTVLSVGSDGQTEIVQETSLVVDPALENGAADIHLSPNGKYLFATNRGENNDITVFRLRENGTLEKTGSYSTFGNGPRNFHISSNGKYIYLGNQHSNNIVVYRLKQRKGKLKPLNKEIKLDATVCLLPL